MTVKVFMDVDGVLRDLQAVFLRYCPDTVIREYDNKQFGEFWQLMASDRETAKELYLDAPVVKGADAGLRWIRSNMSPVIVFLTASGINQWPWLREYTEQWLKVTGCFRKGDSITFVESGQGKPVIVNSGKAVLFDDRVDTVNGIRFPSIGVWVESGLTRDRVRLASRGNIMRVKDLAALAAGRFE